MTIDLFIEGVPAPQGSKTAVVRGGHAVVIEGSSTTGRRKHQAWRNAVHAAAAQVVGHGITEDAPIEIEIGFLMPLPASYAKWRAGTDCYVKPDLDKLVRSTLDGLDDGGLLPGGDSRVCWVQASKRYADADEQPGAHVSLHAIDVPQRGDL